jgi:hypothetical protein
MTNKIKDLFTNMQDWWYTHITTKFYFKIGEWNIHSKFQTADFYYDAGMLWTIRIAGKIPCYYNSKNGRSIYKGAMNGVWHGKNGLMDSYNKHKQFKNEKQAVEWVMKQT